MIRIMSHAPTHTPMNIAAALQLAPHPEGGAFRETWRAPADDGQRGSGTAIYYLLSAGERSHWHRVDAVEIWHLYDGGPLELRIWTGHGPVEHHLLGRNLAAGERPQIVVPAHAWQSAQALGEYALVGCTVSPAFEFAGFEMAPVDWQPPMVEPGS